MEIKRRNPGPTDIHIKILFASACHSDIHSVRSEWGKGVFPMVPGHEIGGEVVAVGSEVTKFKVGDTVGVGCMVDSCRSCKNCKKGLENYCSPGGPVFTYNSPAKYEHVPGFAEQRTTYGGYSQDIVVHEGFVVAIPTNIDLAAATPLLCAGITVWSPIKFYGLKSGDRFAVAGLGGLGSMAVKFARAMGAHVTVISRGKSKKEDALQNLGADAFLDSTDEEECKAAADSFDFLLDCIGANHDIVHYMNLVAVDGKLVLVGLPPEKLSLHCFNFVAKRKSLCGSMIGGIQETQEMMDFCGENGIVCEVERAEWADVNECYERMIKSDVKYRFVFDAQKM